MPAHRWRRLVAALAVAGTAGVTISGCETSRASGPGAAGPAAAVASADDPANDGGANGGSGHGGSEANDESTIVTAVGPRLAVYSRPGDETPTTSLGNPNPDGAPLVLLVVPGGQAPGWWHVLLPVRPNGSTGWVRDGKVTTATTGYRVEITLHAHRLVVTEYGRRVIVDPVGVGRTGTPTPGGRYYLAELLQPPNPHSSYGPYAFGLSGFSDRLHSFAGGPGQIGIHGTDHPELVGHDVSHGCIRLTNGAITQLAHLLPLGTPVDIRP